MEQVKLQEVIEKARKLSALAERGGTKEEAMVAASKLQELLTKYNLSISSLEETEKPEFGRTDFTLDCNSVQRKWRGSLYSAISRANDCEAITIRSKGKETIAIIGRKHNTEIVNYLYLYLSDTIQKLACQYVKDMSGSAKSRARVDFRFGAVAEIGDRLKEEKERMANENKDVRALVVTEKALTRDKVREFFPNLRYTKENVRMSESYMEGRAQGRNIPLRRGVNGKSSSNLRIA